MESNLEAIYFVSAVISLIVLVCFFVMSYNIGRISKKLHQSEELFRQKFIFLISIGDKEAAKQLLIERIESDDNFSLAFLNKGEEYSLKNVQNRYNKYLNLVGLTLTLENVADIFDKLEN